MRKLEDAQIKDKNVLIRIDTDVAVKDGEVQNDRRLRASVPTLRYLIENGAKITIIGHIGRPDGKEVEDLKMRPVEDKLIELLGTHQNWQIMENLRFNRGEEENDPEFTKQLAAGQDIFIQDAFATCHRAHASTSEVAKALPSFAGLSVQKEVEKLSPLLKSVEKPYTLILGGAKIADKLPVIKNMMTRADNFLIGGAISSTFLAARRHHLGKSLIEAESFREANLIWQNLMDENNRNLYLPKDLTLSLSLKSADDVEVVETEKLLEPDFEEYYAVDIGPNTIEQYRSVIKESQTIFWNGNMGISEVEDFANGTEDIAQAIVDSGAKAVIGGGDTVTAVENIIGDSNDNIYLSTGGGATLEFLAGKVLPGLKALE